MKHCVTIILLFCLIVTFTGCAERPVRDNEEQQQTSKATQPNEPDITEPYQTSMEETTVATTTEGTQATVSQTVGSEFIGMEIGPDTKLPDGIQDMGGWLASGDLKYAYALMEWNGQTMVWLEEFIKHDAEGNAYFRVLDVLLVTLEPDTAIVGSMVKDDAIDAAAIGLVVYTDTPYLEDVRRVWTIDEENNKIIEIPADGWKAINEGYGV